MKATFKTSAAAVVLFAAIGATASFAQTVTYNRGDIVIGFQAHSGTGITQNFLFNVGSGAGYFNGNMPLSATTPIANVGDQLTSLYGASWFERSDVTWGAIGMRDPIPSIGATGPVIDGDGKGVIYVSKEATGIGESIGWSAITRSQASGLSSRVGSLLHGSEISGGFNKQNAAAGTDGLGIIVDSSLDNSWSARVPGPGEYSFQYFLGGIEGSLGVSGTLAYLDIYRQTPDSVTPEWVVTFAIDSLGNIYAVPESSTYAAMIGVLALGFVFVRRMRSKKAAV